MVDTSIDPSEVMTYTGLYEIGDKASYGLIPISGGRKSKSGFANTVFNTDFCQIVFGFGLYLRFQNQIVFGFGLYLRQLEYWIYGSQYLELDLKVFDLDSMA